MSIQTLFLSRLKKVHFEDTRVYVEFKSKCESVTSAVNLGVYMAVQMRLLRFPLRLRRFSPRVTMEKLEELENKRNNQSGALMARRDSETGISFCLNHMASDNESIYTCIFIKSYKYLFIGAFRTYKDK